MTPEEICRLLATSQCGAYVMSLDQTILFWNEKAEELLGYRSEEVIGRRCYEVVTGLTPGGLNPACLYGCPSIRSLRAGKVPSAISMRMLAASGLRKNTTLTPMVVAGTENHPPLLVHLFNETEPKKSDQIPEGVKVKLRRSGVEIVSDHTVAGSSVENDKTLTRRELEVLRLVSLSWEVSRISEELAISPHTVRNHIRNLRLRLNAKTKLEAVMTALRLGIL
jgi:DNA-binding CsgD family transcriptional regulator